MKKILFFLVLLMPLVADELISRDYFNEGDAIPVLFVCSEILDSVDFLLSDISGNVYTKITGFLVPDAGESGLVWGGLVPVPLNTGDKILSLSANGRSTKGRFSAEKRVNISSVDFIKEDIPLSGTMSELRTTDSPEKREQRYRLWKLLEYADPESVYYTGTLSIPVDEYIETSFFGDIRTYLYSDGETAGARHNGIDMAAPTGTPVIAAGRGKVVMCESRILTGGTIVIEHLPGVYTLYYHLDSMEIGVGDIVDTGMKIGTVGSTGLVTGPHLHFEMRSGGLPVDPNVFFSSGLIDKSLIINNIDEAQVN